MFFGNDAGRGPINEGQAIAGVLFDKVYGSLQEGQRADQTQSGRDIPNLMDFRPTGRSYRQIFGYFNKEYLIAAKANPGKRSDNILVVIAALARGRIGAWDTFRRPQARHGLAPEMS
ncbi:hypothetical protein DYGSA30_30440 [Dyella sp. GSA-30]|nr:hypothetical protein DYGSA30_30440 [Dyella sp. GSA-30]